MSDMFVTKRSPIGPYEVVEREKETGHEEIVFSHKNPDCVLAFVQGSLEWGFAGDDPQQVDLYYQYRKGHRASGFSVLHVDNNVFQLGKTDFEGISDVFEHCRKSSPSGSFCITLTFNGGFYSFDRRNDEADAIYRAIRH